MDDYFYYLGIAEHIAAGDGSTVDGVAPTNGYHPLWMLICVAVRSLFDRDTTVHVVLTISAILHVAQAWVLYRLLRHLQVSRAIAQFSAIFVLFNYHVMHWNMCGLETPLYVFFLLLTLDYLLLPDRTWNAYSAVTLGVLLGITTLARFDALLFCGLVLTFFAVYRRFGASLQIRLPAPCAGCVYLLILAPWLVWSRNHSGSFLPNSRTALEILEFPARRARKFARGEPGDRSIAALRCVVLVVGFRQSLWPVAAVSAVQYQDRRCCCAFADRRTRLGAMALACRARPCRPLRFVRVLPRAFQLLRLFGGRTTSLLDALRVHGAHPRCLLAKPPIKPFAHVAAHRCRRLDAAVRGCGPVGR